MIAELFQKALIKTLGESIAVFNYGNERDFTALWASDEKGFPKILAGYGADATFIIVWDGTAQAGGDRAEQLLETHLTPLDWALAFSIAVLGKDANIPELRVHIIDLTSRRYEGSWAIRMRHQLLAEMPWTTLHAPLILDGKPRYRDGYRPILGDGGLMAQHSGLWGPVRNERDLSGGIRSGRRKELKALAKQWVASLTQSDDHHDINNIIGPDILAKSDVRRDGLFGAFLTRLEWNGHDPKAASQWNEWDAAKTVMTGLFSAYAIDDQLDQGWARFLYRLLNGRELSKTASVAAYDKDFQKLGADGGEVEKVELFGCLSPLPLIKFLEEKAVFDRRVYRSQLGDGAAHPELIFLDLRLYAGIQEARKQARRLLHIVDKKLAPLAPPLAWPSIDPREIQRIREWSDGRTESARSAEEALLLLPRLLALALPLTPIILFSSTGQAWIRDRLKPYQNIFTGFEKPRVLSSPDSIEASIASLHEALNRAAGMMLLRLQLAHAQSAADKAEEHRPAQAHRLVNPHVEIYADEALELPKGIVSGLAVCFFRDIEAADALQARFLGEFGKAGTVWARQSGSAIPALLKGNEISRNHDGCRRQSAKLANLLEQSPSGLPESDRALWSVVATRSPAAGSASQDFISISAFPDGPLDEVLRFNLEFTLYGLIPYFSGNGDDGFSGTIAIHLPTRVAPTPSEAFARQLCKAFDLAGPFLDNKTGTVWLVPCTSLTFVRKGVAVGSSFPLVRGWLHECRETSPDGIINAIRKIKTTNLSRGADGISRDEACERRLFHDVADWACSASINAAVRRQLRQEAIFRKWFINTDESWYETCTRDALVLMRALKASFQDTSDEENGTDAIRIILQNSHVRDGQQALIADDFCAVQRVLLWMLRHELANACGEHLHSLLVSVAKPRKTAQKLHSSTAASEFNPPAS